jgi:galactokinase
MQAVLPGITALRDVTMRDLEEHRELVSERVYRRCRHVISENARVGKAAEALRRGDLSAFGQLMAKSHHSLRGDYEVSCSELMPWSRPRRIDGCPGSR